MTTPHELTAHNCIDMRLTTHSGMYAWEFKKGGQKLNVRVTGQLAFNSRRRTMRRSHAGFGLTCVPEEVAQEHVDAGRLQRVLED